MNFRVSSAVSDETEVIIRMKAQSLYGDIRCSDTEGGLLRFVTENRLSFDGPVEQGSPDWRAKTVVDEVVEDIVRRDW